MMAVIAATGTTFTPISNPVNLLVMGPGSYRMADYVKVGLPLAVILGAVALVVIPLVWPL
jgi:di/tricarboxylate transporter